MVQFKFFAHTRMNPRSVRTVSREPSYDSPNVAYRDNNLGFKMPTFFCPQKIIESLDWVHWIRLELLPLLHRHYARAELIESFDLKLSSRNVFAFKFTITRCIRETVRIFQFFDRFSNARWLQLLRLSLSGRSWNWFR